MAVKLLFVTKVMTETFEKLSLVRGELGLAAIKAGFVKRDFTWNLASKQESKLSLYRLRDNYLRFYLKYIAPNRSKDRKRSLLLIQH